MNERGSMTANAADSETRLRSSDVLSAKHSRLLRSTVVPEPGKRAKADRVPVPESSLLGKLTIETCEYRPHQVGFWCARQADRRHATVRLLAERRAIGLIAVDMLAVRSRVCGLPSVCVRPRERGRGICL